MEAILDLIYKVSSGIILFFSLMSLFICSLWHIFIVNLFGNDQASRETKSTDTKIKSQPNEKFQKHKRTVSTTPLQNEVDQEIDLELDTLNNIEFDHTITNPNDEKLRKQRSENIENPFHDVLDLEDTNLVPDLNYYYNQYDIEIENFELTTEDGFVIELWHMKNRNENLSVKRKPLLLLHGLLQSCGSFASSGRKSLAYFFNESGYDVWLGNNRCGFNPKWSTESNKSGRSKWNWDINDMVKYDLKLLVEQVIERTGYPKITLIAHSQGTTQGFMGLVNGKKLYENDEFSLNDKLETFVALAPAVYPGPLLHEKIFVKLMAKGIDHPMIFGNRSFMPFMITMRDILVGWRIFSYLSYIMFNYMFDWNDYLWDKKLRDRHFLFSPVNISVNLMKWWLSSKQLSFKHGYHKIFPQDRRWIEEKGPRILLFVPRQDRLVDGKQLINHFIEHEDHSKYKIWYIDEYSHLDVLWAHDVIERIGKEILEEIGQ
ncbi:hypothetical protein Kpol_478p15 [Vanderwaltozyma polyspora DSM 70294]|uniref:sterol esterase n=1 Tax=Vanderwaltozyma polyspora (strain ATCC 22028 / DSM 70294 / BCRC 21397 / CBS 2163 / NBRC 10782 / NRRL Y-8283 / UCD 57-17) TaxID=436907 RepID=A7TPN4_VANPO|nr:uncharacterized protein Kpol_478p15 [Vanderwaltozyma polyspora DSM 70294]EDO15779.1 hypothetical protein Kpol_478p15 [Vanderwaltozyma polyspora DSM 70294]